MVIMIYRMMAQDIARFGTVFAIFLFGFSQAFFIIFLSFEPDPPCPDNMEECYVRSTSDFTVIANSFIIFLVTSALLQDENPMPNFVESILITFLMATGELADVWECLDRSNYPVIGKVHWFLFCMIVTMLLLNLLIAMMGDTYAKIAAIKNEWMRQWARTVLITERSISPAERLRQQDNYCDKNRQVTHNLLLLYFGVQ